MNNTAVWGGGLHVFVTGSSYNNTVIVEHSLFEGNEASAGGGGMAIYMKSHYSCMVSENEIIVRSSAFMRNQARGQAGGTLIHCSLQGSDICNVNRGTNHLRFVNCNWHANIASSSAAVDITTRMTITETLSIVPVFSNCVFEHNTVSNTSLELSLKYSEEIVGGRAALMVFGSVMRFENFVSFKGNSHTALYAISSKIEFFPMTSALFLNNRGRNGGAMALIGSYLSLGDNTSLNFTQNTAYHFGGAIYSIPQGKHLIHQNSPGLNCFIHCKHCESATVSFENNRANVLEGMRRDSLSFGTSIFAESLLSCVSSETAVALIKNKINMSTLLDEIANFIFSSNNTDEVVSSVAKLTFSSDPPTHIIPGKEFDVPIVSTDCFGHNLQSHYRAFVQYETCSNGYIIIDDKYIYMPTNKLKVYGNPGSSCSVSIEREGNQLFHTSFKVTMVMCPPGYILIESEEISSFQSQSKMECACAQQLTNSEIYTGMSNCNDRVFRANILHQYWVGYESDNTSHDNLVTAFCPRSFCSYNASHYSNQYLLPGTANKSVLSKFVSNTGRTGRICGRCEANYSVYFHSPNFLCRENSLCSFGWIFYLLSEICILMILFTVILSFNISFTSGRLNGFLFYAQIIDVLGICAVNPKSKHTLWTTKTTRASVFIYHFLNLDFFHLDSLSFCLWEGATTLDIVAVKYLTIVVAFALVVSVFLFMNVCTCGKLKYYSKRLQLRQSVIHGISTFLVICFAQTVKVTFYILAPGFVMKRGEQVVSSQVLYNGDVELFSAEHVKYVLPGLVLFVSVVVVPTFFLVCYPLGFRILHKCGISEASITKLQQIFCIFRLKPLLDSFQGCYKDNYRCFAGLYFIYRVFVLASYSYTYGMTQFYVLVQVQVSIMLLVHCLSHPYKSNIHNALDALLFTNIAVINGLSIFVHTKRAQPAYWISVSVVSAFQTFLTGLPLLLLLLYTVVKTFQTLTNRRKRVNKVVHTQKSPDMEDIPFRLLDERCESF